MALLADIKTPEDIVNACHTIKNRFGKLDVLVNNAGYGLADAVEKTSTAETRDIFEANFFGTLHCTQTFLPLFRQQKGRHIIQISSHGGFKAFAGVGICNASKFSVEGFSEALAAQIAPLGIQLTIVEPGPFKTNFAGTALKQTSAIIEDYYPTRGAFRNKMKLADGQQESDPQKADQAIIAITLLKTPPLLLPLCKITISSLSAKIETVQKNIDNFKPLAEQSVFK